MQFKDLKVGEYFYFADDKDKQMLEQKKSSTSSAWVKDPDNWWAVDQYAAVTKSDKNGK